jgi:hypothetical protein
MMLKKFNLPETFLRLGASRIWPAQVFTALFGKHVIAIFAFGNHSLYSAKKPELFQAAPVFARVNYQTLNISLEPVKYISV